MAHDSLLLVDQVRLKQFSLLGRVRRLFEPGNEAHWTDAQRIPWMVVRVDGTGFAVSALDPGWAFDPFIRERQEKKVSERQSRLSDPAVAQHFLREARGSLRLGARCERILWSIHRELRAASCSTFLAAKAHREGATISRKEKCNSSGIGCGAGSHCAPLERGSP